MQDYAALYRPLHEASGGKYFGGKVRGLDVVVDLVARTNPRNMLDYGSGKGRQYSLSSIHERWGGLRPHCYDVGVPEHSARPKGMFDGIICGDMMEHIAPEDVDEVLADVFGFSSRRRAPAQSFVYFHISCVPSTKKTLADGRNVHLTVEPPEFWNEKLKKFQRSRLIIETRYETEIRPSADHRPA